MSKRSYADYVKTVFLLVHRNVNSTKTTIEYLSFVLSPNGLHIAQDQVQSILAWPEPCQVKDVQSFPGFGNFYWCFIHRYSELTIPLTQLTWKHVHWNFSNSCRTAFNRLKEEFTHSPILTHWVPDFSHGCWDWCFRLCPGHYFVHPYIWWKNSPCCFLLLLFQLCQVELWHSWQRITHHFWSFQALASIPWRQHSSHWCGHRSQKLGIFCDNQAAYLTPSSMVWVSFSVQYGNMFLSWKARSKTWCFN